MAWNEIGDKARIYIKQHLEETLSWYFSFIFLKYNSKATICDIPLINNEDTDISHSANEI